MAHLGPPAGGAVKSTLVVIRVALPPLDVAIPRSTWEKSKPGEVLTSSLISEAVREYCDAQDGEFLFEQVYPQVKVDKSPSPRKKTPPIRSWGLRELVEAGKPDNLPAQRGPSNAGEPWTDELDRELVGLWLKEPRPTPLALAAHFGRTQGAITSRLNKVMLCPESWPELSHQEWYRQIYGFSPHWDVVRHRTYKLAENKCQRCGAKGRLDAAHLSYENIGNEPPEDLKALCRHCHDVMDGRVSE